VFDQGNYVVVWSRSRDKHRWTALYDISVSSLPPQAVPRVNYRLAQAVPVRLDATPRPRSPQEDKLYQTIEQQNLVWMSFYDSADPDGVASCYQANATLLPNHAMAVQSQANISDFFSAAMQAGIAEIDLSIVEVNYAYEDNIAYEKSTYVFKDQNGNTLDTGKYIVIWTQDGDGTYRLYIDCFNSDKNQ